MDKVWRFFQNTVTYFMQETNTMTSSYNASAVISYDNTSCRVNFKFFSLGN
jgi:hypothetical protein